jgi:alpha-L-fucosidase
MATRNQRNHPWTKTPIVDNYLDIYEPRPIAAAQDDFLYVIEPQYNYRPDLLAFDIYGSDRLWWVFTRRNMDILNDPIFDFVAGVVIYLPKKSSLLTVLGN